jgi:UrcA family protein
MIRTVLIAAAALAIAGAASAETPAAPKGQVVAAKGRDLSTAAGAKAFYRDLSRAASDVCGGAPTYGGLSEFEQYNDCYAQTLRESVAKANSPLVAALARREPLPVRVADR